MLKPEITGTSEGGGDKARESWDEETGETKVEAEGEDMGEGLERASATMFSGLVCEPRSW